MMLIGGLTPGTTYQYRVGDGTMTSGTYSFSTGAGCRRDIFLCRGR